MRIRGAGGRFGKETTSGFGQGEGIEDSSRSPNYQNLAKDSSELATNSEQIEGLLQNPAGVGIERELKVIRVGPNPRMVLCEYFELASRRTCLVNVRVNRKFVKGMKFVMGEPVGELEFLRPWVFAGKLPRRRGRW